MLQYVTAETLTLKHEIIDMQQSTRGEARTGVAALEAWSPMTL